MLELPSVAATRLTFYVDQTASPRLCATQSSKAMDAAIAASWSMLAKSTWRTPRTCPTSWRMKPRSDTRATANRRNGAFLDTIETEITFKGTVAVRREIRKDGKPWERPFQALPGFKWSGGFGTEIRPIFDPQCPTTIRYQGRAEVRGKQLT